MPGGILDKARERLPQRWQAQTLPSLYGVDNYGQLPGVQSHAQFATQAGHALPTDYEGNTVELTPATLQSLCTIRGGQWDAAAQVCILPEVGAVKTSDLIRTSSGEQLASVAQQDIRQGVNAYGQSVSYLK